MIRTEFLARVQERLGFADMREAETATRSVLAALADRLTPEEANDLASQLPHEFADFLRGRPAGVQKMDLDTFVNRVRRDLDIETWQQAADVTRGVFSVTKQAVSEGEWEDVASQLPEELQEMFVKA
jgi:uncharacterized protein (DUF2267 family)